MIDSVTFSVPLHSRHLTCPESQRLAGSYFRCLSHAAHKTDTSLLLTAGCRALIVCCVGVRVRGSGERGVTWVSAGRSAQLST